MLWFMNKNACDAHVDVSWVRDAVLNPVVLYYAIIAF